MVAVVIAVVFLGVVGAVVAALWAVNRNPAILRENRNLKVENDALEQLIVRIRNIAAGASDVDPTSQVILDEISNLKIGGNDNELPTYF